MPTFTLSITRASGANMTVDFVQGLEVEGDELRFWFETTKIKTCMVLRVGDRYSLTRDS